MAGQFLTGDLVRSVNDERCWLRSTGFDGAHFVIPAGTELTMVDDINAVEDSQGRVFSFHLKNLERLPRVSEDAALKAVKTALERLTYPRNQETDLFTNGKRRALQDLLKSVWGLKMEVTPTFVPVQEVGA